MPTPAGSATEHIAAPLRRSSDGVARTVVVLAATVAAVLGWLVAEPVLGIELTVESSAGSLQHIHAGATAGAALLAGLGGWLLLAVLERLTPRAQKVWRIAALAVFVVSLTGPLAASTAAGVVVLVGLHALVAGVLIALLPRPRGR